MIKPAKLRPADRLRPARFCRALSLPALLLAGGCATIAPVAPPSAQIAVPDAWSMADTAPASADPGEYWRQLDDPLLTALVEQAMAQNRDSAVSAARLDAARAALRRAQAGFLPTLGANGGASRDLGEIARNGVQFSAGLEASWEADLFGQVSGNAAAASADLAAAGYGLADVQRLIAGQVALATINGRAIAAQAAIARETLAVQDDNLQIARWRNQAGLVSSLDVEQARAQRAQTAATIPALEASLAATANALSTLVAEPPGRVLAALQLPAAIPRPPEMAGLAAPADVLRRRPDVRSAEASLAAAAARIGVARAQLLPLVRLSGSLSTGQATLGNLFEAITGGLFASASQLIFDGGRAGADVDSAQASTRAALAQWEQAILGALEDVETAATQRRTADQRVVLGAQAVDAANISALLARDQYQAGITDFRDLLAAESQLLSSRNQQISAEADRAAAFVRLTQALGGSWAPDPSPIPPAASNRTAP